MSSENDTNEPRSIKITLSRRKHYRIYWLASFPVHADLFHCCRAILCFGLPVWPVDFVHWHYTYKKERFVIAFAYESDGHYTCTAILIDSSSLAATRLFEKESLKEVKVSHVALEHAARHLTGERTACLKRHRLQVSSPAERWPPVAGRLP